MKEQQKTINRYNNIDSYSEQQLEIAKKILNEYIKENHNTNYDYAVKRFTKMYKNIDKYTIDDTIQRIYTFMFLNVDKLINIKNMDELQKWFVTLINGVVTNEYIKKNINYTPINDDYDVIDDREEEYREDECYTLENLVTTNSNETRLYYHYLAVKEIYDYCQKNTNSILATSIAIAKEKGDMVEKVAIHYSATPSIRFLIVNQNILGIKNVQHNINIYKQIVADKIKHNPIRNKRFSYKKYKKNFIR